jgi:PAS domain S-box-containing protein
MPALSHNCKRTVLIVDDDEGLCRLMSKALDREGWSPVAVSSGAQAKEWIARNEAELMLLDLKLQDAQGTTLVEDLSQRQKCPPFVVITGQGDERIAVEMMKRGAIDYLVKDGEFLQFLPAVVRRAVEQVDRDRRLAVAEAQLHMIRSVVDQGFSAVLIATEADPEPEIVYVNPAFTQATGFTAESVIGQRLSSLVSLAGVDAAIRQALSQTERFIEEVAPYQVNGAERWGEWRVGPVREKGGAVSHWLIIFREITERRRLEREILEISDRERQRIGQDLHDGLCQTLTGIEIMSEVLEQNLYRRSKAGALKAGQIASHVRDAIRQTRILARGLAPVTLESEGFVSGLLELAAITSKLFGIACRVSCEEHITVPDLSVATHLFRIAQEAVSNAVKHGKATEVLISLEVGHENPFLMVSDNGFGLGINAGKNPGMGLHIMKYRAGVIGGELLVLPRETGGTQVRCSFPSKHLGRLG